MYKLILQYNGYNYTGNFKSRESLQTLLDIIPKPVSYRLYKNDKLIKIGSGNKNQILL